MLEAYKLEPLTIISHKLLFPCDRLPTTVTSCVEYIQLIISNKFSKCCYLQIKYWQDTSKYYGQITRLRNPD